MEHEQQCNMHACIMHHNPCYHINQHGTETLAADACIARTHLLVRGSPGSMPCMCRQLLLLQVADCALERESISGAAAQLTHQVPVLLL